MLSVIYNFILIPWLFLAIISFLFLLKTNAPFWKLEETAKSKIWFEERSDDYLAASKWNKKSK